jgi:hypothetical protein
MDSVKAIGSRLSSIVRREYTKLDQGNDNQAKLSKIQTLPAELKLQILLNLPDISAVKNLVIACPCFYPIYRENRYRILLNAHRESQDVHTDELATVLLKIHKLEHDWWWFEHASGLFQRSALAFRRPGRVSFVDSRPSLADLVDVSRRHCWVVEKAEEFTRVAVKSQRLMSNFIWDEDFANLYKYMYYIEIFAALIRDRPRSWIAASLPERRLENRVKWSFSFSEMEKMGHILEVIYPNRFGGTPPSHRRTRMLLVRVAREIRQADIRMD